MILSQKTARGRATMAARIRHVAMLHGFEAVISPAPLDPRGVNVRIQAARGLNCSMTFTAKAEGRGGWGFLGHWHTDTDSDARLSMGFGAACNGSVNQFHQHKATTHGGDDFEVFAAFIDRALAVVAAGDCWDAAKEARALAERGCTAAEYTARFRASIDALRTPA